MSAWTGSTGPYRPSQPAQPTHGRWGTGASARPVSQFSQPPQPPSTTATYPAVSPSKPPGDTSGASGASGASGTSSASGTPGPGDSSHDGIPDPPTAFPELESWPLRDLRLLHDEKAKFEDFVSKHPHQEAVDNCVARIRADVETFQAEHTAITEKMHEVMDEDGMADLRRQIDAIEEEVKGLEKLKDEWREYNSPERLMGRLRVAITESEAESERLEKSMLSSSISFEEFLRQYIECRKTYHERSLKLEQLKLETRSRSFGR